ncbi:hypothetical protein DFA_00676 [Cavenderia fasciculata]|uniref:MHYT domain-containing protein n=1 Tax=Cavenderia fasciculata TaxID=261658 RepID=F4PT75_CACFS|nr:uncharacterized protein DFA_00676 [Cavenderia fasciculata]EGG20811.1 hypothetical protein DFA_00676 [Cavenderia fasciculata]|eukprot:XP_004358661.1 hypothetical protein DFA_00676 [Cavenderia fasciculata]
MELGLIIILLSFLPPSSGSSFSVTVATRGLAEEVIIDQTKSYSLPSFVVFEHASQIQIDTSTMDSSISSGGDFFLATPSIDSADGSGGGVMEINTYWSKELIVLSYLVSVLGSYTSLQCLAQLTSTSNKIFRQLFLTIGSVSLGGVTIWSMHFIGMMACHFNVPVSYDKWLTFLSGAVAVLSCRLGLLLLTVEIPQVIVNYLNRRKSKQYNTIEESMIIDMDHNHQQHCQQQQQIGNVFSLDGNTVLQSDHQSYCIEMTMLNHQSTSITSSPIINRRLVSGDTANSNSNSSSNSNSNSPFHSSSPLFECNLNNINLNDHNNNNNNNNHNNGNNHNNNNNNNNHNNNNHNNNNHNNNNNNGNNGNNKKKIPKKGIIPLSQSDIQHIVNINELIDIKQQQQRKDSQSGKYSPLIGSSLFELDDNNDNNTLKRELKSQKRMSSMLDPSQYNQNVVIRLILASFFTSCGIFSMHYLGMAGMQMNAMMSYNRGLVFLSFIIAWISSIVSLNIATFSFSHLQHLVSGLFMGLGVCGMHYVGMLSVSYTFVDKGLIIADDKDSIALTVSILSLFTCFLIIGVTSFANQRIRDKLILLASELDIERKKSDVLLNSILPIRMSNF